MAVPDLPDEFFEFMTPYPALVVELAMGARELIVATAPEATEMIADANSAVALAYSFTHSWKLGFCHVASYSKYVNLGFNFGAALDDPEGRLVGVGKHIRHISLRHPGDIEDPYLVALVEQAVSKAFRPDPPLPRIVSVTRFNGPKRRPS